MYVNFGALNTHEDDGRRAIKIALALREAARGLPFLAPLQMGITHGVMRTGAYGSVTRRTHSALGDHVNLAAQGQSQIIGIVAEAGLGKSRLVAEVIRTARQKGFVGYGGACQSDAIHTPYQVWKPIWQAFFDVDPEQPLPEQMGGLKGEIEPTRQAA